MKVTLVSFAEGEPFASVRSKLNESAAGAGFDAVQLWSMADFLAAPLTRQLWPSMETLRSLQHRPFCDAFKMVALLHAMERSEENDYGAARAGGPISRTALCAHDAPNQNTQPH
jgi:hypothetical protein